MRPERQGSNPTVEAIVFLGTNLGTNKLLLGRDGAR